MCDCEQQNNQEPVLEQPKLGEKTNTTRRAFLKTAAVSLAATTYAINIGFNVNAKTDGLSPLTDELLKKAEQSSIWNEIIKQTSSYDLKVPSSLRSNLVTANSTYENRFLGLIIQAAHNSSKRARVDFLFTFDLSKQSLLNIQSVIGLSQSSMLEIIGRNYSALDSPYLTTDEPRISKKTRVVYRYIPLYQFFDRPNAEPETWEEDYVPTGWPEEKLTKNYWYYLGVQNASWILDNRQGLYLFSSQRLAEKSKKSDDSRYFDIVWNI